MTIQEGENLPAATLHTMQDGRPAPVTTQDLFAGKKVVLFAVPGAFTPTCSQAHLPGYVVNADEILAKGVDSIICLSVNDAFVMGAWGAGANAEALLMVGDGNGDFTKAIGLENGWQWIWPGRAFAALRDGGRRWQGDKVGC